MPDLQGVSLDTGNTTGNGPAIALRLAADGAHVLIFGRDKRQLDDAMPSRCTIASVRIVERL